MDDKLVNWVCDYKKRLEKGVSIEKTLHILRKLEKNHLSIDVLKGTGIGKVVRRLGKSNNCEVREKARNLERQWMKQLWGGSESESEKSESDKPKKKNKDKHEKDRPKGESPVKINKYEIPVPNGIKIESVDYAEADLSLKSCQGSMSQPKVTPNDDKSNVRPERRLPSVREVKEAAQRINGSRSAENNVEANRMLGVTSRKVRTTVYSGTARGAQYTHVLRLEELCLRVLMDNIDRIAYLGCVPYYLIKPVLQKCTATQLLRIEDYNPSYIDEDDELWFEHCRATFKDSVADDGESWREVYIRCEYERDVKLRNIAGKMKKIHDQSSAVRKTMVCDMAMVKPPKHVQRMQEKLGTAAAIKFPEPGATGKAHVKANLREATTKAPNSAKKPKTAPLMAKSLQLMKSRFRR